MVESENNQFTSVFVYLFFSIVNSKVTNMTKRNSGKISTHLFSKYKYVFWNCVLLSDNNGINAKAKIITNNRKSIFAITLLMV